MQLLIHELAWALGEAWPGRQSIACRAGAFESRIARSRLFARPDRDDRHRLQAGDPIGRRRVPLDHSGSAVRTTGGNRVAADAAQTEEQKSGSSGIERLAVALPITLTVRLGTARLPMAQLADSVHRRRGRARSIHQRAGARRIFTAVTKYRGFPGRIGLQSSFQIAEVVDSVDR